MSGAPAMRWGMEWRKRNHLYQPYSNRGAGRGYISAPSLPRETESEPLMKQPPHRRFHDEKKERMREMTLTEQETWRERVAQLLRERSITK